MLNDNDLLLLITYGIAFLAIVTVIIIIFVWLSRKKIFEKEVEKKDLEIKFQQKILRTAIIAQEEERERIAQELHDDISAKLNLVSLQAYSLRSEQLSEEEMSIIDAILTTIKSTSESSRRIAHNLLPPILSEFGLHEAIKELIHDFEKTKSVAIYYTNKLDFSQLNTTEQLHIFRILQELINNSLKHGKATEITIEFYLSDNTNTCIYFDNGKGLDSNAPIKMGLGMISLENRVLFLNGKYAINSNLDKGFHCTFNFNI